jgi:hypothetical protein
VTRSYQDFVAPGEFSFRRRDNAARLDDVVKFNWEMVRKAMARSKPLAWRSSSWTTMGGSGPTTSSSRREGQRYRRDGAGQPRLGDARSGRHPVAPPAQADQHADGPIDIPDPVQQPAPAEGPSVSAAGSQVSSDSIRALRHAREIVDDMRWLGMTVPPCYTSMAEKFQALVRSGAYATWVATSQTVTR